MRHLGDKRERKRPGILLKAAIMIAMLAVPAIRALAVTQAEMDQARAIAAKFYIRYVNNGAGYLDGYIPSGMTELEQKLTTAKDRESLAQFKKAPVATDYAQWDKAKLAEYWSSTFFIKNASGLDKNGAENGLCRRQIKSAIEGMKVAPEAPAQEAPAAADEADARAAASDSIMAAEAAATAGLGAAEEAAAQAQMEVDSIDEADASRSGGSSGTWVYILVLAILVGVVIFLVIYASRTMNGNSSQKKQRQEERESDDEATAPAPRAETFEPAATLADDTRMREKYARTLASKAEEIRSLTRQLSDMEALAAGLKEENRELKARLESAERRLAERDRRSETAEPRVRSEARSDEKPERTVYLGRVNSKGIFVRADREPMEGQSVYRLVTTDGTRGTFSLIDSAEMEELALEDPGKWLSGGCFAKDIFDTDGRSEVYTETPGTAVFRDGAWRVERKAKIRYS